MRVLAADDDSGILGVLDRSLRTWGYEAITASNGIDAWKVLKRDDCPRIVVLDWDMPGIAGLEVCRLLRSAPHGEEVYVLMLTGRQEKADLIEALEAGADDFLHKPFHPRELQLRLAKGVSFQTSRAALYGPSKTGSMPPSCTTLGGKYRLEKQIAEGGMAKVWLGVHLSLGINVAIKFMKSNLVESADYASFEREARAAAQLRTEHIVRIYDHGIAVDGAPYLVMEYLAGESLADRIDRRGPLPPLEVASIVEQIGKALTEAHGRGIIHRDIKPENILLVDDPERPYGLAKLVDFGLARSRANAQRTDDGGLISGTPSYMTPEHLRAQVPPNPLLDMWGLAATAFTALTATLPFDGDSLSEIMKKVCVAPLPLLTEVNPAFTTALDEWFAKACARAPRNRYQTPVEMSGAFTDACASVPDPVASPVSLSLHGRGFAPTEPDSGRLSAADRAEAAAQDLVATWDATPMPESVQEDRRRTSNVESLSSTASMASSAK
jgi:serine/threonine protein kinase/ActR/RegA family two-component response regulator